MTAFSAAVDVIFADPNMATDGVWYPFGSTPGIPVRVIVRAPDETADFGAARVQQPTTVVDVRVSEVAKPEAHDRLMIGDDVFAVYGAPKRDLRRLVWTVNLRLA